MKHLKLFEELHAQTDEIKFKSNKTWLEKFKGEYDKTLKELESDLDKARKDLKNKINPEVDKKIKYAKNKLVNILEERISLLKKYFKK